VSPISAHMTTYEVRTWGHDVLYAAPNFETQDLKSTLLWHSPSGLRWMSVDIFKHAQTQTDPDAIRCVWLTPKQNFQRPLPPPNNPLILDMGLYLLNPPSSSC